MLESLQPTFHSRKEFRFQTDQRTENTFFLAFQDADQGFIRLPTDQSLNDLGGCHTEGFPQPLWGNLNAIPHKGSLP